MTEILTATEFSSWYDDEFNGMETNRKCIIPILSGLIAKDKFPVLNRLPRLQSGANGFIMGEGAVRDKFRDSETYRLSYNTYISEIIEFLTSFAPRNIVVSDTEPWNPGLIGPFAAGKVYLEIEWRLDLITRYRLPLTLK